MLLSSFKANALAGRSGLKQVFAGQQLEGMCTAALRAASPAPRCSSAQSNKISGSSPGMWA